MALGAHVSRPPHVRIVCDGSSPPGSDRWAAAALIMHGRNRSGAGKVWCGNWSQLELPRGQPATPDSSVAKALAMLAAVELARKDARGRPRNTMVEYQIITDRPAFLTNLLMGSVSSWRRRLPPTMSRALDNVRMWVQHTVWKLLRSGHCDHVSITSWRGTEWEGWHAWPPHREAHEARTGNAQTDMTMPEAAIVDAAAHTQRELLWFPVVDNNNEVDALHVIWAGGAVATHSPRA